MAAYGGEKCRVPMVQVLCSNIFSSGKHAVHVYHIKSPSPHSLSDDLSIDFNLSITRRARHRDAAVY